MFDNVCVVLLSTSMFVGGMTGFIFDNTIPGETFTAFSESQY